MKKFKSLASTHIRKIAILLVISTLSSTILCSCGDDKNSTQIEAETEDETETTTQETTTQKPDEVKDEKTESQKQDADPTETTTQETNDTKPSTQPTNQSTEPTTQAHVHNYNKSETYYTTETQTVHHDAKTHTVHHDAVTHQETKYKTETIERAGYLCDDGAFFENAVDAARYADEHLLGYCSWKQTETVQVPYTETVVDQAAYDETVVDKPAYDEKVEVQVPHTRQVCSCGATK